MSDNEKIIKKTLDNLKDFVRVINERYTERIAYRYYEDKTLIEKTYSDLYENSSSISYFLTKSGVKKKHIAVLGDTSYCWTCTYLGVCNSGNTIVPIDKMLPANEMINLLKLGNVSMIFISEEFENLKDQFLSECPELEKIICFDSDEYNDILAILSQSNVSVEPSDMAEILFTSGTTGSSKGVMLSHSNIASNVLAVKKMKFNEENLTVNVMSVLPIHHTYELTVDNLSVLYNGGTVNINDRLENLIPNLQKFKPDMILIVPLIADMICKKIKEGITAQGKEKRIAAAKKINKITSAVNIDLRRKIYKSILDKFGGNLKTIVTGGAAIRKETISELAEYGITVYQGYGLTECSPVVCSNCPGANRLGSVGKPVSRTSVKIVSGEILVKGPGVMMGYYKNKKATEKVMCDDWFRTGDLGYTDDDGYLYITGRSKNLIILDNGKNIYPEELEGYLYEIRYIKDVMVYDDNGRITALVYPEKCTADVINVIKNEIRELNETLPSYKKIMSIKFRKTEFPKTTTHKIKRNDVLKSLHEFERIKAEEYVAPKTEEQKRICLAMERVLGKSKISVNDDFFYIGGDSLSAMELASILGVTVQDIYERPTVVLLEKVLKHLRADTSENEEKVDVNALINQNANIPLKSKPENILLTGATGFLGSHILKNLLDRDCNVTCLVRNAEKLESVFRYYFGNCIEKYSFEIIIGNIEFPHFGLSDELYKELTDRTDAVIHTAANVMHAGHYKDFEKTNVSGTQNIIDFCMDASAVLHHASTASVNGSGTVNQSNPDAIFNEFVLDIGQSYSQNVYIHSKYKAEEKILIARQEGLKANIYRIGNLTWRTSDGKFQKNASDNGFLGRCRGLFKLGAFSSELNVYPIDFTAVDECAEAYVLLALYPMANRIYNLYNPNVLYINTMIKKFFLRCRHVKKDSFDKLMRDKIYDKDIAVLSFYTSIASGSSNIRTYNDFTVVELKKSNFTWSKISLRYLRYIKNL